MVAACVSHDKPRPQPWISMFDGETLSGWRDSGYGGIDEVHVRDGQIQIDYGAAELSGVTYTQPIPTMDYEISLDAMRLNGNDFFCGLTFPYEESFCTLIVGGWGGVVVGISSFDGMDASENETTEYMSFDNKRWYNIRLRVTEDHIEAWIDDEKVVDAHPAGRLVDIRPSVEPSIPLGLAAWYTSAAFKNIQMRYLSPNPTLIR